MIGSPIPRRAYQGSGRQAPLPHLVEALDRDRTVGADQPDLTLVFDLPVEESAWSGR